VEDKAYRHLSDEELLEKARKKDVQAFTALFEKYSEKILYYLFRYIGDFQKAEDITIETFTKAYQKLPVYKEIGMFSSWLYKIATNTARDYLRKKLRVQEVSMEKPIDAEGSISIGDTIEDTKANADKKAITQDTNEFFYKVIEEMDQKYKDILLLVDMEGMTIKEAASVLNINTMTAGTRLRRARQEVYNKFRKYRHEL